MKKSVVLTCFCIFILFSPSVLSGQSLVSLDGALTRAVTEFASKVQGRTKIVIVEIEAPLNEVSIFLIDELSSHLVSSGIFIVLERGNAIEAVNAEHQFQMSGLVSDESAVGIGQYLGAKVVITGSLQRFAEFSQLRLRAIDVQTGQLLTMHTARIHSDDPLLGSIMKPLDIKP